MIKSSFMDNQIVGADDLNGLATLFVSGGVADNFENGTPYNVSKLNEVVQSNLSSGFVPNSNSALMVTVANGVAFIEPGKVIFPHGQVAEITNNDGVNKESVPILSGQDCYIVLHCNEEENRVVLKAMQNLPGLNDNMVVLAKVAANGTTVTDMRKYAKGKAPSMYASDTGLAGVRTFTIDSSAESIAFDTNGAGYKYMFVLGTPKDKNKAYALACVDLSSMRAISAANRPYEKDNQDEQFYVRSDGTFAIAFDSTSRYVYTLFGKLNISGNRYTITLSKVGSGFLSDWESYMLPASVEVILL